MTRSMEELRDETKLSRMKEKKTFSLWKKMGAVFGFKMPEKKIVDEKPTTLNETPKEPDTPTTQDNESHSEDI